MHHKFPGYDREHEPISFTDFYVQELGGTDDQYGLILSVAAIIGFCKQKEVVIVQNRFNTLNGYSPE